MLNKKEIKEILELCLNTGGDFAEVFIEDSKNNGLQMLSGAVTSVSSRHSYGCSVRILKDKQEVFGYTTDVTYQGIKDLASRVSGGFDGKPLGINFELNKENDINRFEPKILPSSLNNDQKIKYMNQLYHGGQGVSDEIVQFSVMLADEEQRILVANTLGTYKQDLRTHVRIFGTAVAQSGNKMEQIHDSIGRNQGYDFLEEKDLAALGKELSETAVKMLHADELQGGKMTVVLHNAFGGVLLHEACGHLLEATSVAKGASVFANKIGEKIASDCVTAIDDGTLLDDSWGSLNIDDEGNPTQRNVLIENGVLKKYMVDYRNSRIMNHPITGSGRRQSYRLSPTSRMTNTFFAPGKYSFEEIISNTKEGFFAKKLGGGSVDPSTGEFNFSVSEGYLIENGQITKPIRGATLVGSGPEILKNIDMIGNNLAHGQGMCGSQSGSIPVNVGQPTIRVQNITIGGAGGNN